VLRNVAWKTLRDTRRAFFWWSAGLVGLVALIVAVYPTVRDNSTLNKLVEDYPEALKAFLAFGGEVDYVSAPGYLGSELFAFMVPLLLLVAAVGAGARALAGEEEQGTLDLLLSSPISRTRLVLEKVAALAVEMAGLGLVLWVSLVVGAQAASMAVSSWHLLAATLSAALLAFAYGAIALVAGAATGKRGLAIGVTAAAAVAAYLVHALAPLVEALEPAQKASPFYHYAASDPLRHGLDVAHVGVLVAIASVAIVAAPMLFQRRDLSVG
jgi:ABC-2 type transport system permease protein